MVELINPMGDDPTVVNAARVSMAKQSTHLLIAQKSATIASAVQNPQFFPSNHTSPSLRITAFAYCTAPTGAPWVCILVGPAL